MRSLSREAILPMSKLLVQVAAAWGRSIRAAADIILTDERRDHISVRLAYSSEVERGRQRRVWVKEKPSGGTATPT